MVGKRRTSDEGAQVGPARSLWRRGRSARLVAVFAVLAFTPLVLLTFLSVRLGDQAVKRQVGTRVSEGSTAAAALVGGQMRDLAVLVESYAARPSLVAALTAGDSGSTEGSTLTNVLSSLRESHQGIGVTFMADPKGRLIDILPQTPSIIGNDFNFRDWYRGVMATGRPYISEAYQTAATGNARVVAAAAPVRGSSPDGKTGPVLGVLVAAYDLSTVQGFVDRFAAKDSLRLTVTDQRGVIVAAPGALAGTNDLVSQRNLPAVAEALAGRSGRVIVDQAGGRVLSAYAPIPEIGWTVRAEVPTSSAFASAAQLRTTVLTIASVLALVLLGGLALLWVIFDRWTRAEDQRRQSEAFLDSVVDNIPDTVFIKNADDLRIVRINRAGEQLLGRDRQEMIDKSDADLLPDDLATLFESQDREALAAAGVVSFPDTEVTSRGGSRRILHTRRLALRDADDQPRYLLGIAADVTDRHAAEVALAQAKDEAIRANGAKSEFLSRMSHELRTPLNAILGFAQLLEMDELSADQAESVDQILRGGRHLLALINEVLDISRIETGSLALSTEPVDIAEIVDETAAMIRPLASEREITVDVETPDSSARIALADRQRLKQILLNLASNAVKYNRNGGRVTFRCRPGDSGHLRIEVTDTGVGLDADQLARVFVPFDRLGAELTDIEGTGIGLALTRRLAEAMNGRVEASSTPGEGSTFAVDLPIATDPLDQFNDVAATLPAIPAEESRTGGVLYIEDNPANLRLVERVVAQRAGLTLVTTTRGAFALALARRHRPDIILLDVHLPDIDGDAVLFQLSHDPITADLPVVMVTADATPGQIQRLLAAGAADYLTKPLDIARLLRVINQFLGARRP